MNCALTKLILESIRTWIASSHAVKVMAQIELRWIEADALIAWPPLEEFLAILFFARQCNIGVAQSVSSETVTADEAILLESLIVARWDLDASARYLRCFLGEASARAAAGAAARFRRALAPPVLALKAELKLVPHADRRVDVG
jgi:hypothetical protein